MLQQRFLTLCKENNEAIRAHMIKEDMRHGSTRQSEKLVPRELIAREDLDKKYALDAGFEFLWPDEAIL